MFSARQLPLPFLSSASPLQTHIISKACPSFFRRGLIATPIMPYDGTKGITKFISGPAFKKHMKEVENSVWRLNCIIQGTEYDKQPSLIPLILATKNKPEEVHIHRLASSIWNHSFFFHGLTTSPIKSIPTGTVSDRFNVYFDGFDHFKDLFKKYALSMYGGGWVWLVDHNGDLEIRVTEYDFGFLGDGSYRPILSLDLWEHSYWDDYGMRRDKYVDGFWTAVNWEYVERKLNQSEASNPLFGNWALMRRLHVKEKPWEIPSEPVKVSRSPYSYRLEPEPDYYNQ